jgi:hypothetical protein
MDFEKLGAFYLGTELDPATQQPREPVMYEARDLTTHGVCVGMTGSGKTGLCLALLEEALLDGVPVIAIDPKGDLGNLLLTFPALAPADFEPWVDPAQAQREGITVPQLAEQTATKWKAGLAASGQTPERIAKLRAAGDIALYTPGSDAGIPLSVLKSFRAPPKELDGEAWRDRVEGAVTGLLGLVGIAADPLRSREHVLVSQLLDAAWREGRDVELAALIQGVMKPPFAQVGAFDLESFFPAADRTGFALSLNTLLASPSFAAWAQGEPLDIPSLLYGKDGRPRISVLSIAHLGDAERMFFVTVLLNEVVAWMRTQAGTSSLRAIVFMDEVAGYLPPVAMPPAKKPMLMLLKQARAFGIGMLLATQNPVDIDYKALSNAGTWWLGRLQTERDKARVIEGLEGASAAAGKAFDRAAMERTLAGLGSRMFVMNNVHDDHPIVFQSRFVMSYLAGPLTRAQIQKLSTTQKIISSSPAPAAAAATRPVVPGGLAELFMPGGDPLTPSLLGVAKAHYAQAKADIDAWRELLIVAPLSSDTAGDFWERAAIVDKATLGSATEAPPDHAKFSPLPRALDAKTVGKLDEALAAWVYREGVLRVFSVKSLGLVSQPDEAEHAFRARVAIAAREARDAAIDKLRAKYTPKLEALASKQRTAADRVAREQAQASAATTDSAISIGASVLGAIFGGSRRGSVGKVASAARSVSRTASQRDDVARAQATANQLDAKHEELERELEQDVAEIQARPDPEIETLELKAKKGDTTVTRLAILWR